MTQHLADQALSDLLDDALDSPARARMTDHLASCDACSSQLERMRAIVTQASSLPRTLPAPAEEWRVVRARLSARRGATPASAWWTRRSALLAAGLALVILSSAVTAIVLGGREQVVVAPTPVPGSSAAVMPRLAALEHEYATVTRDLERELAERKHVLAPETIAAVERSLRTIDAAITEARDALARDPSSETLARLLVAGHDQKVELLRHAARLATQS